MAEVTGRICFTADRQSVVFAPDNTESMCARTYPWRALRNGTLLRAFLSDFAPLRLQSGRGGFVYRLYASNESLDAWFSKNCTTSDAA